MQNFLKKSVLSLLGIFGAIISAKMLLLLILGQRIAKDYDAAMTIAIFFNSSFWCLFIKFGKFEN